MKVDIKELEKIRDYFLKHDKTTFEHHAYNFLADLIKQLQCEDSHLPKIVDVEKVKEKAKEFADQHVKMCDMSDIADWWIEYKDFILENYNFIEKQ